MRKLKAITLAALITAIGCTKQSSDALKPAQIVGWNEGACATCGGFYVNFSNDTTINTNPYYVLNYPDALLVTVERYYTAYHEHRSPIAISLDSVSVQNGYFHWIRATAIRDR